MSDRGGAHESSLLLTLEEISQLVSHSHDPGETLANIVRLIQGRCHTDVCSVYLLEPERGELVLGATVGLKPESVGRVRMRLDEGLTGLVAQTVEPVNVKDAFQHPRFKYFPEAGEDSYHSFLGVPLVEGGAVEGVLVVQTLEAREFSRDEIRMLVTVASQLAPLVGEAQLLEQIVAAAHEPPPIEPSARPAAESVSLGGVPLSVGVGVGVAYFVDWFETPPPRGTPDSSNPTWEQQRLTLAMDAARMEITRLSQRISELVGEDHGAILQAQLMILQDRKIERDLTDCISAGASADAALVATLEKYVAAFQKVASPFFQDRVYDVKDVFRRLLWHLRSVAEPTRVDGRRGDGAAAEMPVGLQAAEKIVLVAKEVSVMDLFSVDLDRLAGVVAEHGGPQSHAAILARSLGVAMVGRIPDLESHVQPGQRLLVDARTGCVAIEPSDALVAERMPTPSRHGGEAAAWPAPAPLPVGLPRVDANINLLTEVPQAMVLGASGVGLYRSEFVFLARRTLPTEEEQVGIYRKLLTMLAGRLATIRTFDLRPDKFAHCTHLTSMAAGPLDWRLVLDSAPLQKLFRDQVRAILRAATVGPARILIPLVTRTEQLDFVIETVGRARDELNREGLPFARDVPLGIMLEVAAATAMADAWAGRVDFFALGTNDLVASALGIDRDDPAVASLNDPLHPGLIRTIHDVIQAAHQASRPVTVCGEMASDPAGVLTLAALQVDSLSVAVGQLHAVRQILAEQSPEALAALAPELSRLRTAAQLRELLRHAGVHSADDRSLVNC